MRSWAGSLKRWSLPVLALNPRDKFAYPPVLGIIHIQQRGGSTTHRGESHNVQPQMAEVIGPDVAPGMKQANDIARLRVNTGQIGALVQVALRASQGEVIGIVGATMLARDDVLDVKTQLRKL